MQPWPVLALVQKIVAVRAARDVLRENGIPQPDEIDYGASCVTLVWHEPRQMIVIELDPSRPDSPFADDLDARERAPLLRGAIPLRALRCR